jgi:hypothetical protein
MSYLYAKKRSICQGANSSLSAPHGQVAMLFAADVCCAIKGKGLLESMQQLTPL